MINVRMCDNLAIRKRAQNFIDIYYIVEKKRGKGI